MRLSHQARSGSAFRALGAALFAVVVWAVNYPAMKLAFRDFSPLAYTGWRFVLATAILLLLLARSRQPLLPGRLDLPHVLLLSLSGVGVYQLFYALGVAGTSGFGAALLNSVAPLVSLLLVTLLGWERLTPFAVVGSLVAYAGVALFVVSSQRLGTASLAGSLLCLGSATTWAVFSVASSRTARSVSALTAQASTFTLGTACVLLYCVPSMLRQDYTAVRASSWVILVLSSILPLVLAFRAWSYALQVLGVATTASLGFLIPVIAGLTSAAFTGERFGPSKVGAAAVVLAGLAISRVRRSDGASARSAATVPAPEAGDRTAPARGPGPDGRTAPPA